MKKKRCDCIIGMYEFKGNDECSAFSYFINESDSDADKRTMNIKFKCCPMCGKKIKL